MAAAGISRRGGCGHVAAAVRNSCRSASDRQWCQNAATVAIVGAGIAGLGCAFRLRHRYGIHAEVYESSERPGGRIRTLRGQFDGDQLVEEHAEFINPEHTHTLGLVKRFGLQLDNTDRYPSHRPDQLTLRFNGSSVSQHKINNDWHEFGWKLFHDAAARAPFPTLYLRSTAAGSSVR